MVTSPRSSQGGRLSAVRASATVVGETEVEVGGKEGGSERDAVGRAQAGPGEKREGGQASRNVATATPGGSSDRDGSSQTT